MAAEGYLPKHAFKVTLHFTAQGCCLNMHYLYFTAPGKAVTELALQVGLHFAAQTIFHKLSVSNI